MYETMSSRSMSMDERHIAELIFDRFRAAQCKTNQVVMMRVVRHVVIDHLNPKERELFESVFIGLQLTGYFTCDESATTIRLTQKGYDYIYDQELISKMLKTPWVIPSNIDTDWDKAYYRLWRIIGPQEGADLYIKGSDFYNLVMKYNNELPITYNAYIEELRNKGLSTSRADYYKLLLDGLNEEQRLYVYGEIQIMLEQLFVYDEIVDGGINLFSPEEDKDAESLIAEDVPNKVNEELTENHPVVFISYSWDDEEHKEWVLNLATRLRKDFGVEVILDRWEMKLGKPLPNFMAHAIKDSDRVICVMTPNYRRKSDGIEGGAGVEYSIMSAEIQKDIKTEKFIPLLRKGDEKNDIPIFLEGRDFIDMRSEDEYDERMEELARDIWNEPKCKKPEIGPKPKFD